MLFLYAFYYSCFILNFDVGAVPMAVLFSLDLAREKRKKARAVLLEVRAAAFQTGGPISAVDSPLAETEAWRPPARPEISI